ncbi:hypothetical protein MERGE_000572 [Pneumocystis wakefieldiae]|uniref:thioredoxin-dependent peroxiredoxin n=1 Tax=Pneumocystis wakefieldiae TaxID=38082 RepID=A0A899GC85_9ASCO|nr:hypothetical protein MERGE_000572 [Pneumocystis wakefieldiae]
MDRSPDKAKDLLSKRRTRAIRKNKKEKQVTSGKKATRSTAAKMPVNSNSDRRRLEAIHLGDKLPDIILKNELGEDVYIQKIAEEHPVVIFAYPKASTPGCTVQGCGFRDNYDTIVSKNYQVYGLSMDSPKAQLNFKTMQNFPYHLLSDPRAELISFLGASKSGLKTARSHWIFDKGGILSDMKIGVSPRDSVEQAMARILERD